MRTAKVLAGVSLSLSCAVALTVMGATNPGRTAVIPYGWAALLFAGNLFVLVRYWKHR